MPLPAKFEEGGSTIWVNPGVLEDPKVFGYLMSDAVRNAARAYASTSSLGEEAALQAIVDGLAEELRDQLRKPDTLYRGGLG